MARDIPSDDREFIAEVGAYITAARTAPTDYGTSTARLDELETETSTLSNAQDDEDLKETAYKTARAFTSSLRGPAEILFREERNDAYDHATDAELIAAGLDPHKKPSKTSPTPPQNLRATGGANGINSLKWEAGENGAGTQYVIYAKITNSPNFAMVDVVTTLKFDHEGQTPGQTVIYYVVARRRKETSQPSNQAIVFGP